MQDADDAVEVAVVDRQARVALLAEAVEQRLGIGRERDREDPLARDHHVAHALAGAPEDLAEDAPLLGSDRAGGVGLGDEQQELLRRVDVVPPRRVEAGQRTSALPAPFIVDQDPAEHATEDEQRLRE